MLVIQKEKCGFYNDKEKQFYYQKAEFLNC